MIRFTDISLEEFLSQYWQKRPVVLCDALTFPTDLISPEELAGMSLEGISSRIITGNRVDNNWNIIRNISEETYETLEEKDWTLLVEGVDRYIPKVNTLIREFEMIPRFRFDDVMVSYAPTGGSVGPHFDYYDVFLAQYSGERKWQLGKNGCTEENYNPDFALKIMKEFISEEEYVLCPGDVLYVPPKYAHFGESRDNTCITFSFGYRSFSYHELADYIGTTTSKVGYLADISWSHYDSPAYVPTEYIHSQDTLTPHEFLAFLSTTDISDREIWQEEQEEYTDQALDDNASYLLHPTLKVVYDEHHSVYIDGTKYHYPSKYKEDIIHFCNSRKIDGAHPLTNALYVLGYLVKL